MTILNDDELRPSTAYKKSGGRFVKSGYELFNWAARRSARNAAEWDDRVYILSGLRRDTRNDRIYETFLPHRDTLPLQVLLDAQEALT